MQPIENRCQKYGGNKLETLPLDLSENDPDRCIEQIYRLAGIKKDRGSFGIWLDRAPVYDVLPALVRFHHAYHAHFGIPMTQDSLIASIDVGQMKLVDEWFAHARREAPEALGKELSDLEGVFRTMFRVEDPFLSDGKRRFPETLYMECRVWEHYLKMMMILLKTVCETDGVEPFPSIDG